MSAHRGSLLDARPVVVVGEALVDLFEDGANMAGGAPFNVARWLATFGVPTTFVSRIGERDAAARCIEASAAVAGLELQAVQRDPARATGVVRVTLRADGPHYAIEPDAAWDHIDTAAALAAMPPEPAVVVWGTLAQRSPASREAIDALLATQRALRLADLNLRPGPDTRELAQRTLAQADWVKVNEDELQVLLGWFVADMPTPRSGREQQQACRELVERFGVQRVIVTTGEAGWYTLDAQGHRDAAGPAWPAPQVLDTVGAGDAFTATIAAGYACGWPLARSLATAARLASAVCTLRGAYPSTPAQARRLAAELGFDATTAATPGVDARRWPFQ